MIRAALVAFALLGAIGCGKYGPPVRDGRSVPAAAPAATEACPDPNSAEAAGEQTP